jgi:hypothetical protein
MLNSLERLIDLFPERAWLWPELSRNPGLTWRIVKKHPEKDWDWFLLSQNPGLFWSEIQEDSVGNWSYLSLLQNPSLSFSEIKTVLSRIPNMDFSNYSQNPNLSWQEVLESPELSWCQGDLETNPSINIREMFERPRPGWIPNFDCLSANPQLDLQLVREHPELPWNFRLIALRNLRITLEEVQFFARNLDFRLLSSNPALTREIFLAYRKENWSLRELLFTTRDSGLAQLLLSDPCFLKSLKIPENFIERHFLRYFQLEEGWKCLALLDSLQSFQHLRFNRWERKKYQSRNCSLNWQEVASNPENYEFTQLSRNLFQKDPIRQQAFREKARKTQRLLSQALRASGSRGELQSSLDLLRLRREDLELRGCLNHKPRLLTG